MKILLLSIVLSYSMTGLFAHPHMFFSNRYLVEADNGIVTGVKVEWIFDIYFSKDIVMDFDMDKDGKFNLQETQRVHDLVFINLAKYGFFQLIRQGDKRYNVDSISDFTVFLEEDLLVYQFYIDLTDIPRGDIWLATYDPTFFCSIDYVENDPVILPGNSSLTYAMEENPDNPVYYDPFSPPSENPIHKKWKPGLSIFIPTEVHISYD